MEQISDVQLAFLRALWARPGSSVAQVKQFLACDGRALAPTTVATQLSRLEKKGLVSHEVDGRQYLYRALVSQQQAQRSAIQRVTNGLFGGDMTALVHQLLNHDEIGSRDLAEVKRMIEARETEDTKR